MLEVQFRPLAVKLDSKLSSRVARFSLTKSATFWASAFTVALSDSPQAIRETDSTRTISRERNFFIG
jgi:hypothetical protein